MNHRSGMLLRFLRGSGYDYSREFTGRYGCLLKQSIYRFQLSASRGTMIELSNDTVLHVDQSPETLSIWINGD